MSRTWTIETMTVQLVAETNVATTTATTTTTTTTNGNLQNL